MIKRKAAEKTVRRRPKPEWPVGKSIPAFDDLEEEDVFWQSYRWNDVMDAHGEARPTLPEAAAPPLPAREHVYRVRLDDAEMAALRELARRRGVSASVVIRELLRMQWARVLERDAKQSGAG